MKNEESFDLSKIESITMDDFVSRMHSDFKREHPVAYWVDNTLFKGHSVGKYSAHYGLTHPWKLLEDAIDEIRWAWQRVFRGWDDRVVWSVDYWLAEIMPVILTRLKNEKMGTPSVFFDGMETIEDEKGWIVYRPEDVEKAEKAWDAELDKMINTFNVARSILNWDYKSEEERLEAEKVFNDGMDSFKKHFFSLWD